MEDAQENVTGTPEVGDSVRYVPHVDHGLDKNAAGDFAWSWRLKPPPDQRWENPALTHEELARVLHNPSQARNFRSLYEPVAPAHSYPATVTAVNENGTLNLTVQGLSQPGNVHDIPNVKSSAEPALVGHTWFKE